jgi:hypothetical protein
MQILVVSNVSGPWCGVAEWGRMLVEALRTAGHSVIEWDGHYPAIYEKPYLPPEAATVDHILVNWHPVTLNHYLPQHFPAHVPISLYVHDLPPWSTCPLWDRAQYRFAAAPYPGTTCVPYACVTDPDLAWPWLATPPLIGWTGVRGDGLAALTELATRRGWRLNISAEWLGTRDEITRLSRSTLNVLWYQASGRGQSLALRTAAAAGRPILVNDSTMFDCTRPYLAEFYRAGQPPTTAPYLEPAIDAALHDIWFGAERCPDRFIDDHAWSSAIATLEAAWRA